MNNNLNVYACCVDATKAFDRVHHDKLFELLMYSYREIPAIALRALLDVYQRQPMRTVWKGKHSRQFATSNGIRQGGVVSPVLFCVYFSHTYFSPRHWDLSHVPEGGGGGSSFSPRRWVRCTPLSPDSSPDSWGPLH